MKSETHYGVANMNHVLNILSYSNPQRNTRQKVASMSERIEGWAAIAEYFPCAYSTFLQRHRAQMLIGGYVLKSHVNRATAKKNP